MTDRPAVIVTGVGAHADPWHGLPATSTALGELVAERMPVRHLDTDDLAAGASVADAALLVVNASADLARDAPSARTVLDPLLGAVDAGTPLLAVHSTALAFRDDPRFAALLGGRWVPDVSMHPQIGWSLVQPTPPATPFRIYDERYSHLEVAEESSIRAIHTDDGVAHALSWLRPGVDGRGGVAYSGLGHGVEAYRASGHRRLLHALIDELLEDEHEVRSPVLREPAPEGIAAAAIDFEIVAFAARGEELAAAPFDDRFDDGELLTSGYLLVERRSGGRAVLHSHGRAAVHLSPSPGRLRVQAPDAEVDGRMLRTSTGIALVAETGAWRIASDGSAEIVHGHWRVVAVHGPAPAKIENRVRLLDDLRLMSATQEEQHA